MKTKTFSAVKVPVTESERGWGRKIEDYMVCLSTEDALNFTKEFNSKNSPGPAPDWYMQVEDDPIPFDITEKQLNVIKETEKKRIWLSFLKNIK